VKILFKTRRNAGVSTEQIAAMRLDEAAAVWRLVSTGFVREIYFSPEGPAVIGVVEAESTEEARQALQRLPMPAAGLIDFDLFSLQPYDQFALLFGKQRPALS
jgi:muconolactone delta-isomerase